MNVRLNGLTCLVALLVAATAASAEAPALWGTAGEAWLATGRLPDFRFAGYKAGMEPIPSFASTRNVRDFGALGDGMHDDAPAFAAALANFHRGVVVIPPGRYFLGHAL